MSNIAPLPQSKLDARPDRAPAAMRLDAWPTTDGCVGIAVGSEERGWMSLTLVLTPTQFDQLIKKGNAALKRGGRGT